MVIKEDDYENVEDKVEEEEEEGEEKGEGSARVNKSKKYTARQQR